MVQLSCRKDSPSKATSADAEWCSKQLSYASAHKNKHQNERGEHREVCNKRFDSANAGFCQTQEDDEEEKKTPHMQAHEGINEECWV